MSNFKSKKKFKKIKKNKKTSEHDISPLCRGPLRGPTFTVFGMWGPVPDVITHVKFQIQEEIKKKFKNKKTSEHDISPLCRGPLRGPTFTVFGMWGPVPDVITHVKFQIQGFGGYGAQNRGFHIDFDRRPYNNVAH